MIFSFLTKKKDVPNKVSSSFIDVLDRVQNKIRAFSLNLMAFFSRLIFSRLST